LFCKLLTALRQAGQLRIYDGQATVVGTGLPSDFLSAVHGRLSDLSERVRRLVDADAVLARPFTLHEAAGLLGCSAVSLVPAATDAVTSGTFEDHQAERGEFVRQLLQQAGIHPDHGVDDGPYLWERPALTDPDVPPRPVLLLHAIAERQRWQAEYTAA
jgi:hypothetical protein